MSAQPAGWYADPKLVNTRRYWDGQRWTEHRQETPAAPVPGPSRDPSRRDAISRLEIWGMFAAVFVAPLGLVFGLVLLVRGFTRGGTKIVLTSLAMAALATVVGLVAG